ncbi:MAG: hypothetical protein EPN82_09065 [Bacteroidetes bacterium]|nr:MAG: hypothetical protein EPN82_09065 [Bacteroidota bacterium]
MYNLTDHLGSIRSILKDNDNGGFIFETQYDSYPFGGIEQSGWNNRQTWLGKEKDRKSNPGDFGVRKYDDEIGRFTSIDLLFEKYYGWTPYQYL